MMSARPSVPSITAASPCTGPAFMTIRPMSLHRRVGRVVSCCYQRGWLGSGLMATPAGKPARAAIDEFIRDLADRGLSPTTQRIRRRFLQEYLQHAEQAAGTELTVAQLLEAERGDAWLADAA